MSSASATTVDTITLGWGASSIDPVPLMVPSSVPPVGTGRPRKGDSLLRRRQQNRARPVGVSRAGLARRLQDGPLLGGAERTTAGLRVRAKGACGWADLAVTKPPTGATARMAQRQERRRVSSSIARRARKGRCALPFHPTAAVSRVSRIHSDGFWRAALAARTSALLSAGVTRTTSRTVLALPGPSFGRPRPRRFMQ